MIKGEGQSVGSVSTRALGENQKGAATPRGVDGSGEVLGQHLQGPNLHQHPGGKENLRADRGEVQRLKAGVDKEARRQPLGTNEDGYCQIFVRLPQHSKNMG